jgi:hypothetical protein
VSFLESLAKIWHLNKPNKLLKILIWTTMAPLILMNSQDGTLQVWKHTMERLDLWFKLPIGLLQYLRYLRIRKFQTFCIKIPNSQNTGFVSIWTVLLKVKELRLSLMRSAQKLLNLSKMHMITNSNTLIKLFLAKTSSLVSTSGLRPTLKGLLKEIWNKL